MDLFPASTDPAPAPPEYELVLFIAGDSVRSAQAQRNLERICTLYLPGRHHLEVVDVAQDPARAVAEGLLGMPCLLKKRPGLVRRLVGDLSDTARVLKMLGLQEPATVADPPA